MLSTALVPKIGRKVHPGEITVLIVMFGFLLFGLATSFINKKWFEDVYTSEDSLVEYATVLPLIAALFVAISYMLKLMARRSWMFLVCMLFAAVFSIFVAGEEISWGQRLFHIESSAYFKEHNAQQETNLHNMIIDGEKVNKIIFTWLLGLIVGFYLLLLPYLYQVKPKVAQFINWAGIPIPHRVQIIAVIALAVVVGIIPSAKGSELLELGISSVFLLILLYPENVRVFRK